MGLESPPRASCPILLLPVSAQCALVSRPGGVPEWAGLRAGWRAGGGGLDAPCRASRGSWEPAGDAGLLPSGPRRPAPGPRQPG